MGSQKTTVNIKPITTNTPISVRIPAAAASVPNCAKTRATCSLPNGQRFLGRSNSERRAAAEQIAVPLSGKDRLRSSARLGRSLALPGRDPIAELPPATAPTSR